MSSVQSLLLWRLAIIAPLILFLASSVVFVLAPQAFLIFVPYLLIPCAVGAVWMFQDTLLKLAVTSLCLLVFAASILYASRKPGAPNDYQGIAQAVLSEMQSGDLVFLRNRDWVDTPLFYYINDANFVVSEYEASLQANPASRVWLITWPHEEVFVITDARREALSDYDKTLEIEKLRARAELFEPEGKP